MLDLNLIKNNPEFVSKALAKKGWDVDFSETIQKMNQRVELLQKVEGLKAKRNQLSASVPQVKKAGGDVQAIFAEVKQINADMESDEKLLQQIENEIKSFVETLPNIPDEDLLPGEKENNKVVKVFGEKPTFDFKPKDHVELAESLGLVDYERGAKISGRGTWIYTGLGAQLEWALINYFIQEHLKDGYTMILPPHLLNEESGYTAGQFPKFKQDVFWLEGQDKFMLPTAETALVNLHRKEILSEEELPKKYFSYTPCYRMEAGSYRTEERGMIRGYQFNKVEMVQYTTDATSDIAFLEISPVLLIIYIAPAKLSNTNDKAADATKAFSVGINDIAINKPPSNATITVITINDPIAPFISCLLLPASAKTSNSCSGFTPYSSFIAHIASKAFFIAFSCLA